MMMSCWHKKIKTIFFWLFVPFIAIAQNMNLKEGDLLFKQAIDDKFTEAIALATKSIDGFHFTHVGIATFENNKWYIVEAISKGVSKTPLATFADKKSVIVVARLKEAYQKTIPEAVDSIKKQIGKPYDLHYAQHNDAFYCSELVQKFYTYENKELFPAIKMTFKNIETKEFPPYWIAHFKALNSPIPEGELGSNPGDLSKSDKIDLLGKLLWEENQLKIKPSEW